MKLPIEIEEQIKSFIEGRYDPKSWVHAFLKNGIAPKHNWLYGNGYNGHLLNDIILYLKENNIKEYKKWRKRWRKYIKKLEENYTK